MYPETINKFQELVNQCNLSVLDNGSDLFVYGFIPHSIIGKVRKPFQLHVDEEVLWVRDTSFWNEGNQGLVVTDWGITIIPDNDKSNEITQIKWEDVQYAEYSGKCIYFFLGNDRNNNISIHITNFLKEDDEYTDDNADLLARIFTEIAQTQDFDTAEAALARMEEYAEQDNFVKVIEEADNALAMSDDKEIQYRAFWNKTWAYECIGNEYDCNRETAGRMIEQNQQKRKELYLLSLKELNMLESIVGPQAFIYHYKARLHYYGELQEDSDYLARRYSIASLQTDNQEDKEKHLNLYKDITELLIDDEFCDDFDIQDRQFLLLARDENHIAGMYDPDDNIKWVFTLNQIPSDVQFEGLPQANTLYLAHPVRQNLYLPYEGAEEKLFMDKVREFCYLVQCLGATEVVFHSNKGMRVSESFNSTQNISGGFSNPFVDVNGEHSRNNSGKSNHSQRVGVDIIQTFAPIKYPYQPNDLVWLATDSSWKQLIKQRLEGGMLSYTYKIRSTDVSQVSNNQITDIKASFRFMLQNANANYNENNDTTFSKREETEWSIQVTFKPLNEFEKQSVVNTNVMSSNEEEYIEEFKACLNDNNGSISNSQRRLLEKMRVSLRVSESRAKELEAMCSTPQLTDDEKEYWEEYKECLNDGGSITPSERRLLERLRKSLGISEERALEIERF